MNIPLEFTWKTALQAADALVFRHTGQYLSDLEIVILRGAWDNHTYEQIAEAKGYTSSYLCRDVGCKLWGNLSTALQERVSKKNFKAALQRQWRNCIHSNLFQSSLEQITITPESLFLNSTFYLERSPIESVCYETIFKPGSLIRIKGAKWMGKTSLVQRILEQAKLQAQRTVYLDLASIEREIIQDLDKLLCWLAEMISSQLKLKNKFQQHLDLNIIESSNKIKYTSYFEEYILAQIKSDLVLALDNIDYLFAGNRAIKDFLMLLHSWHKKGQSDCHWSKLKLILTHSTKTDIPANLNRSPFVVGVPILLEEFNLEQVKILANLYQLNCDRFEIERLIDEVGGHPYFLKLAMYQRKTQNASKLLSI